MVVAEIAESAKPALTQDYQLDTHAIGDQANREILNWYEQAFARAKVEGVALRWRIEHAQHVDPADIGRLAELGLIAAFQGIHSASDGPLIPNNPIASLCAAVSRMTSQRKPSIPRHALTRQEALPAIVALVHRDDK